MNPAKAANGLIAAWSMRRFIQLRPEATIEQSGAVMEAVFEVLEEICNAKNDDAIDRVTTFLDLEEAIQ